MAKPWTIEDIIFLQDKWGSRSLKSFVKKFNRSPEAIRLKAGRLGLGDPLLSLEGITVSRLAKELGESHSTLISWIKHHEMPASKKSISLEKRVWIIGYEKFWEWAESHKQIINLDRLEPNSIGIEPEWVAIQRVNDRKNLSKRKRIPWNKEELRILSSMVNAHRYTYKEIANRIGRSEIAVKRKLYDLNSKARPIQSEKQKYTETETELIISLYTQGKSFDEIADDLNRTATSVRARLERLGYKFTNGIPAK